MDGFSTNNKMNTTLITAVDKKQQLHHFTASAVSCLSRRSDGGDIRLRCGKVIEVLTGGEFDRVSEAYTKALIEEYRRQADTRDYVQMALKKLTEILAR